MEAVQLIYSALGASPVAIILVYYLGKVDKRISLLEQQVNLIREGFGDVRKNQKRR